MSYSDQHAGPPPGASWQTIALIERMARNNGLWGVERIRGELLIELGSRRVVHVGVTRSPSSARVTRQLRESTAWGEGPPFLIRDHDDKFGGRFDAVARGTGIKVLRTPVRAPNANAMCERMSPDVLSVLQHGAATPGPSARRFRTCRLNPRMPEGPSCKSLFSALFTTSIVWRRSADGAK